MDDLQITRLCARAAGVNAKKGVSADGRVFLYLPDGYVYSPLKNRAQALELVERLDMRLHRETQCNGTVWNAAAPIHDGPLPEYASGSSPSILRAIGLCAARVQQSKESQK